MKEMVNKKKVKFLGMVHLQVATITCVIGKDFWCPNPDSL